MNKEFEYKNYVNELDSWDREKEYKSFKKRLNNFFSSVFYLIMCISLYIGYRIIDKLHLEDNNVIAIFIAILFFILIPSIFATIISKLKIRIFYWIENKYKN